MTGLMSINGTPGAGPTRLGTPVVDISTGLIACNAVLAAIIERFRSGLGQAIEVPLYDCALSVMHPQAANALMFSLYFSGYLSMLLSFKQQAPDFEVPDYLHTHPVLEASNRWAQLATDGHLLAQLAQPIIRDTQDLLDALN